MRCIEGDAQIETTMYKTLNEIREDISKEQ